MRRTAEGAVRDEAVRFEDASIACEAKKKVQTNLNRTNPIIRANPN
jgi:hypothetical protein